MMKLMRDIKTIIRDKSGMILPLALVLMAAGTFIIVPGLWTAQAAMTMNRVAEADLRAYYAADAGILDAYWKLKQASPPNFPYSLPVAINGYTVTLSEAIPHVHDGEITYYTIQASTTPVIAALPFIVGAGTGVVTYSPPMYPAITPSASVIAQITRQYSPGNNVFNHGVVSLNGNITMSGSAIVTSDNATISAGDIYANGSVTLSGGASVNGNAWATGAITDHPWCPIKGSKYPGSTALTAPTIDVARYQQEAAVGGHVYDLTITNETRNLGPLYVDHNLTIGSQANVTLTGTIYVVNQITLVNDAIVKGGQTIVCDKNITLAGAATQELPKGTIPLYISVNGNVTVTNGAKLSAVVYAPNGSMTLTGDGRLYGSVVAKSISIQNSCQIKYLTGVREWTQLPGAGLGATATLTRYVYRR